MGPKREFEMAREMVCKFPGVASGIGWEVLGPIVRLECLDFTLQDIRWQAIWRLQLGLVDSTKCAQCAHQTTFIG